MIHRETLPPKINTYVLERCFPLLLTQTGFSPSCTPILSVQSPQKADGSTGKWCHHQASLLESLPQFPLWWEAKRSWTAVPHALGHRAIAAGSVMEDGQSMAWHREHLQRPWMEPDGWIHPHQNHGRQASRARTAWAPTSAPNPAGRPLLTLSLGPAEGLQRSLESGDTGLNPPVLMGQRIQLEKIRG